MYEKYSTQNKKRSFYKHFSGFHKNFKKKQVMLHFFLLFRLFFTFALIIIANTYVFCNSIFIIFQKIAFCIISLNSVFHRMKNAIFANIFLFSKKFQEKVSNVQIFSCFLDCSSLLRYCQYLNFLQFIFFLSLKYRLKKIGFLCYFHKKCISL